MTTPEPVVTPIPPTKAKAWVALIGGILTFVFPLLTMAQNWLPAPWPAVIGAVLAIGTTFGVWRTPNSPKDTVVVPNDQVTTLPPGTGYTPTPDLPPGGTGWPQP